LDWNSWNEIVGIFVMFSVNAVVTGHFEVFIRNVDDEFLDELDGRNSFGD